MLTVKEKVIKYLKYSGVSQDKFSRTCNVSSGFLRQGKSFSIDLISILRDNYPDLNMNWLIFDEGNMLIEEVKHILNEDSASYKTTNNTCKSELIELQKHLITVQKELIETKNELLKSLKKNTNF